MKFSKSQFIHTRRSFANIAQTPRSFANIAQTRRSFVHIMLAVLLAISLTSSLAGCFGKPSTQGPGGENPNGQNPETSKPVEVKEGSIAPDFEFVTMDGKKGKLSDYRGKVVLLNFWASWCGPCVHEMPDMQRIADDYPSVVILAVNRNESTADATKFANDKGYSFIWALDEDKAIQAVYPSNGIPYTIVIDKDGVIGTIYVGSANDMYPYFEKAIKDAGATK